MKNSSSSSSKGTFSETPFSFPFAISTKHLFHPTNQSITSTPTPSSQSPSHMQTRETRRQHLITDRQKETNRGTRTAQHSTAHQNIALMKRALQVTVIENTTISISYRFSPLMHAQCSTNRLVKVEHSERNPTVRLARCRLICFNPSFPFAYSNAAQLNFLPIPIEWAW